MRFARLFDFTTGQLLLLITTDSTVEGYVLSAETYYQGDFIRSGFPFESFGDASESMDELTDRKAERLYQSLVTASKYPSSNQAIENFEKWLNQPDEPDPNSTQH